MRGMAADRGSVSAEFVAVVPAVALVLALSLGGFQLATRQLQLQDAAALAARSAARGEEAGGFVSSLVPGATARIEHRGDLLCVRVEARGTTLSAVLGSVTLSATSCALANGR